MCAQMTRPSGVCDSDDERLAEQAGGGEGAVLEDVLGDVRGRGAGFEQFGGDAQGVGGDVLEAERAGVGDDAREQARRDFGRDRRRRSVWSRA